MGFLEDIVSEGKKVWSDVNPDNKKKLAKSKDRNELLEAQIKTKQLELELEKLKAAKDKLRS